MTYIDIHAWRSGEMSPTEREAFYAGYHYNEAALVGFGICPALLVFTQCLEPQRHEIVSMQLWTAMWKAFDDRNAEIEAEDRKAAEKFAKRPNRYACSAEGCGIVANTGKALLRCAFLQSCPLLQMIKFLIGWCQAPENVVKNTNHPIAVNSASARRVLHIECSVKD